MEVEVESDFPPAMSLAMKRLIIEFSKSLIVKEAAEVLKSRKARETDLLLVEELFDSSDSESNEELVDMIMLMQTEHIEEETAFIMAVDKAYNFILSCRDHILRPYQAHIRTDSGANRMKTIADIEDKFGREASRVFRFSIGQLNEMIHELQIPVKFKFCGHITTGVEALVISLHRLATGCRFIDLSLIYDLLPSFLSQIFAGFMIWLYKKFSHKIRTFAQLMMVDRNRLEIYASSVEEKGCPLKDCVGFCDGTHLEVCKPVRDQGSFYCGHHSTHCFKSLVIQLPNGLLLAFGPFNGTQHDSSQSEAIQLDYHMSRYCTFPDRSFNLYCDSGFAIGYSMITPFRRTRNQTPAEADWNNQMSADRVTVEWGIGRVKTLFYMLKNKNTMKTLLSPVALYWFNSIFLANVHACLNRRCEVSLYFNLEPPTLAEYMREF